MLSVQNDSVATNQEFFERDSLPPYVAAQSSETGISTIDNQHRMLICRLEQLERTVRFPSRAFAHQALNNFTDLVIAHLRDERRFLERMNYPGMEELQQDHEWSLIELTRIRDEFRTGDSESLPSTIEALWQWTINHIVESDSRYMPFLTQYCRATA